MRAGKPLKNGEFYHYRPFFNRQTHFLEVLASLTILSRRTIRRGQTKDNSTTNKIMKTNYINLKNTHKYG
jgi:hypothetical protein